MNIYSYHVLRHCNKEELELVLQALKCLNTPEAWSLKERISAGWINRDGDRPTTLQLILKALENIQFTEEEAEMISDALHHY